jgi:hypothetical protein
LSIAIAKTVGKLGLLILKAFGLNAIADGIASVADTLYTILKWPFELVYNWVMDKLGGKSPSEIGLAIVDGIKSVVDMLFDVLTYPFKKAAQIIPEIINILKTTFVDAFKSVMDVMFDLITYPFKKGFELIKSAVSEVGTFLKDTFSGAFTFIIGALEKVWEKMKGIGSFISDTIGKTFSFVGRIVGTSEESFSRKT